MTLEACQSEISFDCSCEFVTTGRRERGQFHSSGQGEKLYSTIAARWFVDWLWFALQPIVNTLAASTYGKCAAKHDHGILRFVI